MIDHQAMHENANSRRWLLIAIATVFIASVCIMAVEVTAGRIISKKMGSSLYTWIYRIALNMCFSQLRKRKMPMIPLDDVERTLIARKVDDGSRQVELENLVSNALGSLPPKQRAVFAMRFYEKMTFKEISEAMGTTVGAAKANHHFAVERLRRILSEAGVE